MGTITFRCDDVLLRVVSEDHASLAWLEEFVRPGFERLGPGAHADGIEDAAPVVRYTADAASFAALLREGRACATGSRPCFALDAELVQLPAWEARGGTHLLDEANGCVLSARPHEVGLVADPLSPTRRLPLLRVVRELLCEAWSRRAGRLQLHAAALASGDEALLLVGPKNAGKTTLLLHALAAPGSRFITNDRVGISTGPDGAIARGMPTVVSIRPVTVARFPRLLDGVPAAPHLSQLDDAEWRDARARLGPFRPGGESLRLSPGRLCAQLGIEAVAGARLGALLLCRLDPAVPVRSLLRLPVAEARAQLLRCVYGADIDRSRPTVLAELVRGAHVSAGATHAKAIDALLTGVPAFACGLGPRAHEAAADLSREVLECAR